MRCIELCCVFQCYTLGLAVNVKQHTHVRLPLALALKLGFTRIIDLITALG